jgi:hypothetical protein
MEIFDCSPKAKAKIQSFVDKYEGLEQIPTKEKYPWTKLAIGQAFIVGIDKAEANVRNLASVRGKELKKKFCVIKHEDLKIFEVARIE